MICNMERRILSEQSCKYISKDENVSSIDDINDTESSVGNVKMLEMLSTSYNLILTIKRCWRIDLSKLYWSL